MTSWQVAGLILGFVTYAVAWIWGGRPERFGAGLLLFACLLSSVTYKWSVGGYYPAAMIQDGARFLAFGWLCFRADRWWPLVITAALGLMVLLEAARLLDPAISHFAMASGLVGLGYLVDLTLLLGVWERSLAGDAPACRAAWAKADRMTAARRQREAGGRKVARGPALQDEGPRQKGPPHFGSGPALSAGERLRQATAPASGEAGLIRRAARGVRQ